MNASEGTRVTCQSSNSVTSLSRSLGANTKLQTNTAATEATKNKVSEFISSVRQPRV